MLNCPLCLKYSKSNKKQETSLSLGQEVPIFPWTKLATDLFHFEGDSYLLIDYTSQFPFLCKLTSLTGQNVAEHFKQIFAKYEWPDTIVSDNGPCYATQIFKGLMKEYQVNHITSLPHYPQSNGLAEKYVQILKNLFHKMKEEGQDLHKCLMVYRNTSLSNQLQSPMQILSSKPTKTSLPMSNAARKQVGLQSEEMRCRLKNQYLPTHDLSLHQAVMYQDPVSKKWYPAKITKLCDEPRSYIITTEEGTQYRKTQTHLKAYQPQYQAIRRELKQNRNIQANDNQKQSRPKRNVKPPERLQII